MDNLNMLPTEIEYILSKTEKRRKRKKELDREINLNETEQTDGFNVRMSLAENDGYYRMITDGAVDMDFTQSDALQFYMRKGTCKFLFDNMEDTFLGRINIGHSKYIVSPVGVGTFNKKDLRYGEDADGFGYIDIKPRFNYNLSSTRDLINQGFPFGLSIEMTLRQTDSDMEDSDNLGVDVFSVGFITGLAVVGASGDSMAGNIPIGELQKQLEAHDIMKEMKLYFNKSEERTDLSKLEELLKKLNLMHEEDSAEDKSEDKSEDNAEDKSEDNAEDKSEDKSEDNAEDKAEDKSDDKSEDEDDTLDELTAELVSALAELKTQLDAVTEQNAELQAQLDKVTEDKVTKEATLKVIAENFAGIDVKNLNFAKGDKQKVKEVQTPRGSRPDWY